MRSCGTEPHGICARSATESLPLTSAVTAQATNPTTVTTWTRSQMTLPHSSTHSPMTMQRGHDLSSSVSRGVETSLFISHGSMRSAFAVCAVDGGTIDLKSVFPDWDDCAHQLAPPHIAGTRYDRLWAAIKATHPDWSDDAIDATLANMEHLPDGTVRPWLTRERHMKILRGLWEHTPTISFRTSPFPSCSLLRLMTVNFRTESSSRLNAPNRASAAVESCPSTVPTTIYMRNIRANSPTPYIPPSQKVSSHEHSAAHSHHHGLR